MAATSRRLRFSLRLFLLIVASLAISLGILVGRARQRDQQIAAFRDEGAIVYYYRRPPAWLASIGVTSLDPFFHWWRAELYVTLADGGAIVGDRQETVSIPQAKRALEEQATRLHELRVDHIDLCITSAADASQSTEQADRFVEFLRFGNEIADGAIGEAAERYRLRLEANRQTGRNTNPYF